MDGPHLAELFKPLLSALGTLAVAFAYGRALLRFAPSVCRALTPLELNLFSLGIGVAALSHAVFLLGLCGLYYDATFLVVAAGALAAWIQAGRKAQAGKPAAPLDESERRWRLFACVLAVPFLPYWVTAALAPEIGPDALGYHLGLVARYYREHALVAATENIYGFLSQGMEMVYLFAYAFGRANAPKIIHFALFLATPAALVAFSRRFLHGSAGWMAAGLYAFASIVATDATMAYNDCAVAFFGLLVLHALLLWQERRGAGLLALTAALAGFAFSLKLTAGAVVVACGLAVGVLAWRSRRDWEGRLRPVGLFTAVAALFVLPWVGRNVALAGNPAAPFFNSLFPNPHVTLDWERGYRDFLRDYRRPDERRGWIDAPAKLLDVTVGGDRTGGIVGPVFLLTPLLVPLAWGTRRFWPLLAAAAVTTLPWLSNGGTRFLIPALPFVGLLMAQGVLRLGRPGRKAGAALLLLHAGLNWTLILPLWRGWPVPFLRLEETPWREALRIVSEREYRNRRVHRFRTAEALKKAAPPGTRAFFIGSGIPEEPFPGVIVFSEMGAIGQDLARDLEMVIEPDFRPEKSLLVSWTEALEITGFRLNQTGSAEQSWWEVAEIRPWLRGRPFAWPADWDIEVSQYPFRKARLIDGDPLTLWRSWQPLRPGRIELRGKTPITADALQIIAAWGQHWTQYEFELFRVGHGWQPFLPGRDITRLELSAEELTRRIREAYAETDISLVATDTDSVHHKVATAIDEDPAAFALEPVWEWRDERVYRVVK